MTNSTVRRSVVIDRRPVVPDDVPLLRNLFADAHVELSVLPPDTRFVLIDMQFRAERRRHADRYPQALHEILLRDGREVGRIVVDRSSDAWQLVDLTVSLGHRREGIASAVLAETIASATAEGRRLRLTAWAGNEPARALCARAGMSVAAEADGYVTLESAVTPVG